ncbi:MAG: response regulator [Terriglobales bacterium]
MASATLLCIDDSLQVLQLRKAALESYGYCVEIAASGEAAIKILRESPVAAVLLEYKLEGMDAEAVAYHIKQRFPDVPVILVSAYSEIPERTLWLVDDYVMKSEMPDGVARVIQRALHSAGTQETYRRAVSINLTDVQSASMQNCSTGPISEIYRKAR